MFKFYDILFNIETIQSSTTVTVNVINSIAKVVSKVNEIVAGIATSFEQQDLITSEISIKVSQTSEGINEETSKEAQSSVLTKELADMVKKFTT